MDILRVPSFSGSVQVDVPEPSIDYTYTVEDLSDGSTTSGSGFSSPAGKLFVQIPTAHDANFKITVDAQGIDDVFVTLTRPYVDPNTATGVTTASDIAAYAKNEEIARAIIDSVITEGFYYKKYVLQTTGNGADYMPLWVDAKKIRQVYQNNVLVYDASDEASYIDKYSITKDNTAIIVDYTGQINRSEGAPIRVPIAPTDNVDGVQYYFKNFHSSSDYIFVLDVGYRNVPADIKRATEMLVEDIACGKLDYYNRYVSSYNTDQFKLSFDKRMFEGTGNVIVDKILSKYTKSIRTLGAL